MVTIGSAPGICSRMAAATPSLMRVDAVERQRAADRDRKIDEGRFADGARAHVLDLDHAGHARGDRRDLLGGALRRGVGQRVDGAACRAASRRRRPARATASAAAESAHAHAEAHADEPDQHRERRPQIGGKMQRVGFQRLALMSACAVRESARARKKSTTIETDDHAEGPASSHRPHALRARSAASPPPRSPRPRAGTAARFPPAPRRFRPCRGRNGALRRPACRRCARRHRSSPWRRGRSASGRPPTGSPASRWRSRRRPWRSSAPPRRRWR